MQTKKCQNKTKNTEYISEFVFLLIYWLFFHSQIKVLAEIEISLYKLHRKQVVKFLSYAQH